MSSRKEEIRTQAAALFRKKGYSSTSMRDIAEAVGIKAASIYNHIQSKQDLLEDLLLSMAHLFTQGMADIQTTSLSPEEKLEKIIALHVRLSIEHTDAISLITSEWVHLKEPAYTVYRRLRDSYETDFKEVIEQGKKEGIFRRLDTDVILFSTLSTLRWLYSWYSKNSSYNSKNLEEQLCQILINGIKE